MVATTASRAERPQTRVPVARSASRPPSTSPNVGRGEDRTEISNRTRALHGNDRLADNWKAVNTAPSSQSVASSTSSPETDASITNAVMQDLQERSAGNQDAAQLTAGAYEMAVEQVREQYPDMPAAERMDTAMAISTYALNGPGNIEDLKLVDDGSTSVVAKMQAIQQTGAVNWGEANGDLDKTNGQGTLHPGYNDKTPNQAYHTNFFIAAGYVSGGDPGKLLLAEGGNLYHETLDPNAWAQGGGSMADFAASTQGLKIGLEMNRARQTAVQADAGQIAHGHDLDLLMPGFAYGGMSQRGNDPPRLAGMSQEQYEASRQVADSMRDLRESPIGQLATEKNPFAWPLISFFQIPPALNGLP